MLSVFGLCFIAVTFGEYLAWVKMVKKWWGVSRMRDIKFRVFDNELKYMHVCGENQHDTICFYGNNIATYYNLQNGCGSLKDGDGNSTYELMQYTGLKDKNGVEIYEGDVVKNSGYPELCVVEFFEGQCIGRYRPDSYIGLGFYACERNAIEVIGNIHQNQELLVEG